jgi:hypothetical protein
MFNNLKIKGKCQSTPSENITLWLPILMDKLELKKTARKLNSGVQVLKIWSYFKDSILKKLNKF